MWIFKRKISTLEIEAKFLNKVVETLHGVVCYPYNASPLNLELFQLLLPCTWNTKERLHRDTAWSHFHCRLVLIHSVPSRAPILAAYIKNRMTHECVSGKQLHIPCHPEELAASQNKKCPQTWSMRRTIATSLHTVDAPAVRTAAKTVLSWRHRISLWTKWRNFVVLEYRTLKYNKMIIKKFIFYFFSCGSVVGHGLKKETRV